MPGSVWRFGFRRAKRALPLHSRRRRLWDSRWLVAAALVLSFLVPPAALAGEPGAVGDLYVTSLLKDKVVQFDGETGELVGDFVTQGSSELDGAWGLAWGPNGNLFVCSFGVYHSISGIAEYDGSTGALVRWLVGPDEGDPVPESGWLDEPSYLAFGSDGNLYVSGQQTEAVHKYDGQSGEWLGVFAIGGFSPGGLRRAQDLTFGPNGNLFVISGWGADNPTGEGRGIMEYHHATGRLVHPFTEEDHPDIFTTPGAGLLFRPNGNLLLTSTEMDMATGEILRNEVLEFDGATGELLGAFVADGSGLDRGTGMTWGPNGNLFVASQMGSEVIEYDGETGALVGTFASVWRPMDLAFKPPPADPMPAPTATGISTSEADACDGLCGVTVTGTNLDADETMVMLANPNEPVGTNGLVTTYVSVVTGGSPDGTSLTVDFDLDGGARMGGGVWDVEVVNPDGQSDTLVAAVEVSACRDATAANPFTTANRNRGYRAASGIIEYDGETGDVVGWLYEDPGQMGVPGHEAELWQAPGLTFGADGDLYVATDSTSAAGEGFEAVLKFDGVTGRRVGVFVPRTSGGLQRPRDLTFGPNGNLFVVDQPLGGSGTSAVFEYDGASGAFVRVLVPRGTCGLANGTRLRFAENGNLLVNTLNEGVIEFDGPTGDCIGTLVPPGPPGDQFEVFAFSPHTGNILVAHDPVDGSCVVPTTYISEHDADTGFFLGDFVSAGGGLEFLGQGSFGMAFGPSGNLFVTAAFTATCYNSVIEYDGLSGALVGPFAGVETTSTGPKYDLVFKPLPGDVDGDWDLDLGDFAAFQRCFGGDGVTPGDYNCLTFDHDLDGDVGLKDAAALSAAMTGPK